MLSNDITVLLLLPLIGNSSAERSVELSLVQSKLRENRVRYKAQIDLFNSQADEQERRHGKEKDGVTKAALAEAAIIAEMNLPTDDFEEKEDPELLVELAVKPPIAPSFRAVDKIKERQVIHFATILSAVIPPNSSNVDQTVETNQQGSVNQENIPSVPCSISSSSNSSNYSSDTENSGGSWSKLKFNITSNSTRQTQLSTSTESDVVDEICSMTNDPPTPSVGGTVRFEELAIKTFDSAASIRRTSSLMRPKSMGHILDKRLASLTPVLGSEIKQRKNRNILNVLFAAPLAWRDRSNRLHPLEVLDYGAER